MFYFHKLLFNILVLLTFLFPVFGAAEPILKAKALAKGDTIGIVAPGKPGDHAQLAIITENLIDKGFKVMIANNVVKRHGYFAGTDEERAGELMKLWVDKRVDAIWSFAGGYGSSRLFQYLDFEKIRQNPKVFVGMSDVTALHAAIQKETGLITFLAPNLNLVFGPKNQLSSQVKYCQKWLWKAMSPARNYSTGYLVEYPHGRHRDRKAIVKGKATGALVGGNLAIIASLTGTKWQINTRGKILILEDVNEKPYKIDRMLWQLEASGALDNPAGVVLASWIGCKAEYPAISLSMKEVFADYFSHRDYPVWYGFPSGHLSFQAALPLGAVVELDSNQGTLRVLESPII